VLSFPPKRPKCKKEGGQSTKDDPRLINPLPNKVEDILHPAYGTPGGPRPGFPAGQAEGAWFLVLPNLGIATDLYELAKVVVQAPRFPIVHDLIGPTDDLVFSPALIYFTLQDRL